MPEASVRCHQQREYRRAEQPQYGRRHEQLQYSYRQPQYNQRGLIVNLMLNQ